MYINICYFFKKKIYFEQWSDVNTGYKEAALQLIKLEHD